MTASATRRALLTWRDRLLIPVGFFLRRRVQQIGRWLRIPPNATVLDLGGGSGALVRYCKFVGIDARWTVADLYGEVPAAAKDLPDVTFVALSEGPLPFADSSFDVVICNAVIEHVTLSKQECTWSSISEPEWRRRSFESQVAFAAEIRRVGESFFVETPHRDFPIDSHLWLPFTNWFPHSMLVRMGRYLDRYWIKSSYGMVDWNLLRAAEMRRLFPEAEIHIERVLGLPKAVIAVYNAPSLTTPAEQ